MKSDEEKTENPTGSGSEPDTAKTIGGWMITLVWIIALGAGTFAAQNWFDERQQRREGISIEGSDGSASFLMRADRFGQFWVKGIANKQEIVFLVDTGATGISIPDSVASRLGLIKGDAFPVQTANGTTTVYSTRLRSLSIGPFSRNDVPAHINPSMDGEVALLGMSFLRHYELLQRAGELTISAP